MSKESMRAPKPWFRVTALAAEDGSQSVGDVYVYDEIGESWWGGLSPKSLVDEIAALDVDTLTVHINSPGGAAWDGITIMNALRQHRARVEVVVDGLAASAASAIAMSGDKITMNRGAQMMIHDASGMAWGNAATMEETAGVLHKLSDSYADIYAARAGGDREKWREAMRAESWYTAEEAVAAGLADAWDGSLDEEPVTVAEASFDLSRFRFPGRAHAPAPVLGSAVVALSIERSSPSGPSESQRKDDVVAYDDLTNGLRARLGVTDADATDETLLAAVDEALAERAEPAAVETAEVPEGAVVMEAAALAALQADAAAGRETLEAQATARREGIVAAAVRDGRVAPASRDKWLAALGKDEAGTADLLASFPKNTIPVAELGASDDVMSAEDALYAAAYGSSEKGA